MWFGPKFSLPSRQKIGILAVAVVGCFGIGFIVFLPQIAFNFSQNVGDRAVATILADKTMHFQTKADQRETELAMAGAAKKVLPVYARNPAASQANLVAIQSLFNTLFQASTANSQVRTTMGLSAHDQTKLLTMPKKQVAELKSRVIAQFSTYQSNGLVKIEPAAIHQVLAPLITGAGIDSKIARFITTQISAQILPNQILDSDQTNANILTAKSGVLPQMTHVLAGQPLVIKNQLISENTMDILRAYRLVGQKTHWQRFLGIVVMVGILGFVLDQFMTHFNYRRFRSPKYVALVCVVVMIILLLSRVLMVYQTQTGMDWLYLTPIPMAAMILSWLMTPNISMLVGTIVSILVGFMVPEAEYLWVYLFLSSCFTVFFIYRKYRRTDLIRSGYWVGFANGIIGLTMVFITGDFTPKAALFRVGIGLISGVFSAMITMAMLPYLESLFNITTAQSLFEHSNLNHPLLKQLMMIAPGTYQHSIMVANLAEAGAEAIHADVVLTRVGAYFHDVGKLKRPAFFSENQFGNENPHAHLTPKMSKMVIASHPKDGVELATKYQLPEILKSFMIQHHGTSRVSFFYDRAVQSHAIREDEDDSEFRYPGIKPNFKESGIVMLADCVEAAVRSLEKHTPQKIALTVDKLFKEKIEDHQLDDCALSLKDISQIRAAFLAVFQGIYHTRLDYQDALKEVIGKSDSYAAGSISRPVGGETGRSQSVVYVEWCRAKSVFCQLLGFVAMRCGWVFRYRSERIKSRVFSVKAGI